MRGTSADETRREADAAPQVRNLADGIAERELAGVFLQIGEHKYGKPILDRVLTAQTPLRDALKCALVSMGSTLCSNLSLGMPLGLVAVPVNACAFSTLKRIEAEDEKFLAISEGWSAALKDGFSALSSVDES